MKIYYKLFRKGKCVAKTASIKVAKNLTVFGWDYVTIKAYE